MSAAARILDLGGAEALRAVVDGRTPGIVPAELAVQVTQEGSADYLRGLADGYAQAAATHRVESVWSGPHEHTVPVRSTEQALVDLVAGASEHLWLMTYSARPHRPVLDALGAARSRGVRVRVVVETLQGAGGALAGVEPGAAFLGVPGVELWHWPVRERPERSSRMHAKIAVADRRVLLVSSANLTQSGTVSNIEAGLLVRGGTAPRRATEHLEALVGSGTLARLAVGA
ncbi:DISARM system phospholipase D-like protein DrmC [Pseudonocardia lutea]|uniref:DISARM system phospholipase D-like protein DrmC n=1 Tax=Pseudonocardia lutea TaxID=2172015 RepID=A0ABW1I1H1_9PSEU